MKRIILLILCIMFCFCACSNTVFDSTNNETLALYGDDILILNKNGTAGSDDFFIGAWLSYMELTPGNGCSDKAEYSEYISGILKNLKEVGVTDLFVQVRPFADAIYPSKLFPSSSYVVKKQGDELPFDFLEAIINCASASCVNIHAWINPYRIQREYDPDKLCDSSTAKKWLESGSPNVVRAAGGLYFNPVSAEVQKLIIDGVRELLESYELAGIHIDDYFYPTADESFDKKQFNAYRKSGGELSLADWRRENVSSLVSGICSAVKSASPDKVFSISPGGDIDKDRDEMFADVELWCAEDGYCDAIIPQIYYGFENGRLPFEQCALRWKSLVKGETRLIVGLALYKSGKEDAYAGENGKNEWTENDDVIKRQAEFLIENGFDGLSLYSAKFVKFNKTMAGKQSNNLKLWYTELKNK